MARTVFCYKCGAPSATLNLVKVYATVPPVHLCPACDAKLKGEDYQGDRPTGCHDGNLHGMDRARAEP